MCSAHGGGTFQDWSTHIKDEPCAKQRALLGVPPAVAQAFLEDNIIAVQFLVDHL
jgi:hypothetical protein